MRSEPDHSRTGAIRIRAAIVIGLLLVVIAAGAYFEVRGHTTSPFMSLGHNVLAPLELVEFCQRKPSRCATSDRIEDILWTERNRSTLGRVQAEINRQVSAQPSTDGKRWTDAMSKNACFEYALAKRSRLLDLGYPSSALLLAVAVVSANKGHLVLVAVTDKGDYVLDNLAADVVRWDQLPYHWISRSSRKNPMHWQAIRTNKRTETTSSSLDDCS